MLDQKWYRSSTLWFSIVGWLLSLLVQTSVIDITMHEAINDALIALGNLLVIVGIFNNPTRNHVAELKLKQANK